MIENQCWNKLEYKKFIEQDGALDRRFQRVLVEIPDHDTVLSILKKLKPIYEKYHNVMIPDNSLNLIIELSDKYIYDRNHPDKAIDLLDEVCESINNINDNRVFSSVKKVMKKNLDTMKLDKD